jgi:Uma2 family endonuclease
MFMAATVQSWTPNDVRALQREERTWPRYELVDGELLVTPAPNVAHQRIAGTLFLLLRSYTDRHRLGETLFSPADIALDARSVLQPDLFVVPADVTFGSWPEISALLLAVEVLSPSSARHDRIIKRRFFQRHRVAEYWIVDTDARIVERWQPDDARPEIISDVLAWQPSATAPALAIELDALFAPLQNGG